MFWRNSKMKIDIAFSICSIESALYEMLLECLACCIASAMESEQSLWKTTIVETLGIEHVACHSLVIAFCNQSIDVLAIVFLADVIQLIKESKVVDL